jgi:catechol 2,3-dioxygenase-like lactoylglutathione lyase family enzyme
LKFSYVTLYVHDLETVRDWYVEVLGLQVAWGSGGFARLVGKDGLGLGLHRGAPLADPGKVQLHFEVPDVDAIYEQLLGRGVVSDHGPTDTSWGYRVATLHDPAGHTVELFTPRRG